MIAKWFPFFSIVVLVLISCQSQNLVTGTSSEKNQDKSEITVGELKRALKNDDIQYLIDVREPDEHNEGSIPGAILIPRGEIDTEIKDDKFWDKAEMDAPKKSSPIVLFCRSGYRSKLALKTLKNMGYKNVKFLSGGWLAWSEKN